jgi:hypothetical protein
VVDFPIRANPWSISFSQSGIVQESLPKSFGVHFARNVIEYAACDSVVTGMNTSGTNNILLRNNMDLEQSNLPKCIKCDGRCCRDLAMPATRPRTRYDIDLMKWYLHFEGMKIFIKHHRWFILVDGSRCKHLNDQDLCSNYEKRMQVCREHNPPECELFGKFYDVMMTEPEDVEAYLNKTKKKKRAKNKRKK